MLCEGVIPMAKKDVSQEMRERATQSFHAKYPDWTMGNVPRCPKCGKPNMDFLHKYVYETW